MKTVSGLDPMARYKNVYRAEFGGKSVMVAGITVVQAAEEAAMYFGISLEAFRESGVLIHPSAQETLSHCKRFKKTAEMLVKRSISEIPELFTKTSMYPIFLETYAGSCYP